MHFLRLIAKEADYHVNSRSPTVLYVYGLILLILLIAEEWMLLDTVIIFSKYEVNGLLSTPMLHHHHSIVSN